MTSIYSDGACNSCTDGSGWGSVVDEQGKDLLGLEENVTAISDMVTRDQVLPIGKRRIIITKFDDLVSQQNNSAELFAMVAALRIALKNPKIKTIKCDSDLICKWWSIGHVALATRRKMNKDKLAMILTCGKLRAEFEKAGGTILKISGDANLADLGYHK
jgi:ribonuclease HI